MFSVRFDFQAKVQLMAIRVAVVTGSSSGSSNARDDAMATVNGGEQVYQCNFKEHARSRVPSSLTYGSETLPMKSWAECCGV